MTSVEVEESVERHCSIMNDATARGAFRGASPLRPVSTAFSARPDRGSVTITDGPFMETKEALGGYYLIDCQDAEEAKYWAARLAQTGCATSVEARPLASMAEAMQRAAGLAPGIAVHA